MLQMLFLDISGIFITEVATICGTSIPVHIVPSQVAYGALEALCSGQKVFN